MTIHTYWLQYTLLFTWRSTDSLFRIFWPPVSLSHIYDEFDSYEHPVIRLPILILTIALFSTACVGTKSGAYRVFTQDLQRLVGETVTDAHVFGLGYLKGIEPNIVNRLSNGNDLLTYNFKHNENNGFEACTVLIEAHPRTQKIVNASSGGIGCWRPY